MLLKIRMARVLEYRSTMDSSGLTINWYEPKELYDYIVVIDPARGGSENGIDTYGLLEKDLTLQVAKQIQKQFDLEGVRLYCTRTEDVDGSPAPAGIPHGDSKEIPVKSLQQASEAVSEYYPPLP